MNVDFLFTSESVTEGHPDKLCDRISDAVAARVLQQDPAAGVVIETAIATGIVFVAAGLATEAGVDVPGTARDVLRRAGYGPEQRSFDVESCTVMTTVQRIGPGTVERFELDALDDARIDAITVRDQATVFGYACDHTPELLPMPVWLAHALARRLTACREEGRLPFLAADGKTQVGVDFRDRRPVGVHSVGIVASQQAADEPGPVELREALVEHVVGPVFERASVRPGPETRYFVNPHGPVVGGGPALHSGMTGRKTAIDTYGEYSRYSASALSGKDPSRIDRVGAYAARHAAKNVVAAGLARECEVQLSYAIGLAGPVSVQVDTFGTGTRPDGEIRARVLDACDFRLAAIVRDLALRTLPSACDGRLLELLSAYGHVGRSDLDLPWERTDLADALGD